MLSDLARGSFKASIPKLYIKTLDLSEVMAKRKKKEEFANLELTPEGLLEPIKNYLEQPSMGSVIGKRLDQDKKKRKKSLSKKGKSL